MADNAIDPVSTQRADCDGSASLPIEEGTCTSNRTNVKKAELIELVKNKKCPESWEGRKISYGLMQSLFEVVQEVISENGGRQDDMIRESLGILDDKIAFSSKFKVSNLKRSVFKKLDGEKNTALYADAVVDSLYKAATTVVTCNIAMIGVECVKAGITKAMLSNILQGEALQLPKVVLTNEMVRELDEFRKKEYFNCEDLAKWICALSASTGSLNQSSVWSSVERMLRKKMELTKYGKMDEVKILMAKDFCLPVARDELPGTRANLVVEEPEVLALKKLVKQNTTEIEALLDAIASSGKEISILTDVVRELSQSRAEQDEELVSMKNQLSQIKEQEKSTSKKLEAALKKLGKIDARNVHRRESRKDQKIEDLSQQKSECEEKLEKTLQELLEKSEMLDSLNKKLILAGQAKRCEQKMKSHYKTEWEKLKAVSESDEIRAMRSILKEQQQEIRYLENENAMLEERIEHFLHHEVESFQQGRYKDEIRQVYQDLMCIGVGANNVESIIRNGLEKIGGISTENLRLPQKTFAKYMFLEARGMAQIQLAEELLDGWQGEDRTLYSDGTSKFGYPYATFDVKTGSGEARVVGLRDLSGGTAVEQLEVMKEVLKDVVSMREGEDKDGLVAKIIYSIKNLMSDRCIVQKKFNEILDQYRRDVVPTVVEGWEKMTELEQEKVLKMNDFFCGLHYIVGMADQTEAGLKVYEQLLFGCEKVGSLRTKRGYSKGESGTLRLIRTVCKAVQAKGCEKSGRPVQFQTYLRSVKGTDKVPLAPFKGNRFNITFYNGAGIYYLHSDLLNFFKRVHSENRLLGAVHDDLQINAFIAGCRALGLISKLVTGPLWRILEDESVHVLDMTSKYQHMLHTFERWAEDASEVLKGDVILFEGYNVVKDQCFQKLVEASAEFDVLTLQALELIFAALVVKTKRLLADHLEGGKYEAPSEEQKNESKTVVKTNVMPERDFGMLDRLIMEKPRSTTLVLEGIIMFNKNKTGAWRDKLPQEKRALVMQMVRQSKDQQRKVFATRQLAIRQRRNEKMEKQAEEEEKKAQKIRVKKQMLMDEIEKVGLWKTEQQVKENVKKLVDESEKVRALSLQIQFRKVVLSAFHPEKEVFQMSAKGIKFDSKRLTDNLIAILQKALEDLEEEEEEETETAPPVLQTAINPQALEERKQKYREEAAREQSKAQLKRKQGDEGGQRKKRKKSQSSAEQIVVPVVHTPEDLIGKRVRHFCADESGSDASWYEGCVMAMCSRGHNPFFEIYYDGYPDVTYKFQLMTHLQQGILELIPLTKKDLLGANICHRLKVGNSDEWFKGKVLGVVSESNPENPDFSVEYEGERCYDSDDDEASDEEDANEGSHVEDYPLLEDYLNGDLRLL